MTRVCLSCRQQATAIRMLGRLFQLKVLCWLIRAYLTMYPTAAPPQEDSCTSWELKFGPSASECYKYYLSRWILTWLVTRVGCEVDGNMQLPATCWKGMSAEDQVSNGSRHRKAGAKVPWCLGNVHALNAYL